MLPDYLAPDLGIVFVGTAASTRSAARGHYYAGPGNEFWRFLFAGGLTPTLFTPEDDHRMLGLRLGLTDLVKSMAQSHDRGLPYDVATLAQKIARFRPGLVAFTSKQAGQVYARAIGRSVDGFGPAEWLVQGCPAFVLPSPSAANRTRTDPPRVEWWRELGRTQSPGGAG